MITAWELYWITRLDGLNSTFNIFAGIFILICLILLITRISLIFVPEENNIKNIFSKLLIPSSIILAILVILCDFIPTTKQAIVIYCVPKILNNEVIKEDLKEFYNASKKF